MPLDFPSSPTLNENYSFGTKTWIWNGNAWALASSGAINSTPIGNLSPSTGAFTTLSATGNVTGNFFLGNGSQLTGIDATSIQSGTSNVRVISSGGNVSVGIGGTGNVAVFSTGGQDITGYLTTTGNITGNYLLGNGSLLTGIDATSIQSGTSNVRVLSSGGNVSIGVGGSAIVRFTSAGILNDMGNGTGNIGNATGYFNTIFAKATSAQYADLAENYTADASYEPGTVVIFGGRSEVTQSISSDDHRVAGVVSSNPSYLMNADLGGEHVVALALQGRVPCRVTGFIARGDLLVSAPDGRAQANNQARAGTIVGKALESFTGEHGVIEIAVGRD